GRHPLPEPGLASAPGPTRDASALPGGSTGLAESLPPAASAQRVARSNGRAGVGARSGSWRPHGTAPFRAARPRAERSIGLFGIGLKVAPAATVRAVHAPDVEGVRFEQDGGPRRLVRPPQRLVLQQKRVQSPEEGVVVRGILSRNSSARENPAATV